MRNAFNIKLKSFVEAFNFLGIKSFFNKQKNNDFPQIEFELFELAVLGFINSSDKELTNSHNTVLNLLFDFENVERKHVYAQLTPEQKHFLQAISEVLKNRPINNALQLTEAQSKVVQQVTKKQELYREKRNQRDLYNKLDDIIQKELQALKKEHKDDRVKVFNDKLSDLIAKAMEELKKDPKLGNEDGKLKFDIKTVNLAIYERISLQVREQLGLPKEQIDTLFRERNTTKLKATINSGIENSSLTLLFTQLVPPHLFDIQALDLASLPENFPLPSLKDAIESHLLFLKNHIDKHISDPSKNRNIEDSLQSIIQLHDKYQKVCEKIPAVASLDDIEKYKVQLQALEAAINGELTNNPKNKLTNKNSLSNYEKRAISIIAKLSEPDTQYILTEANAKFISDFVLYAEGNMEFNKRLGNTLKSKDSFVAFHKEVITDIHKFTFKTRDSEKLFAKIENYNKLTAVEDILNHLIKDKLDKDVLRNILNRAKLSNPEKGLLNTLIANPNIHLTITQIRLLELLISTVEMSQTEKKELQKAFQSPRKFTKQDKLAIENIIETKNVLLTEEDKRVLKDILGKLVLGDEMQISPEDKKKLHNVLNNLSLTEDAKITLEEIGKITKLGGLESSKIIKALNKNENHFGSKALQELRARILSANVFEFNFNQRIKNQTTINIESGDILLHEDSKFHKVMGAVNKGFKARITAWITPYSHAAVGIVESDTKAVKVSHMVVEQYIQSEPNPLGIALYQETFRVLPDRLLNRKFKKQLLSCLNIKESELKKYLQDKYKDISKELHNNEDLTKAKLNNSSKKQMAAGLADFIPFGHKTTKSNRKWAQKALENKGDIGSQLVKDKEAIICSEFAAKMTVLALVELEKQLIAKIQEKDPKFKAKTGQLINMPFGEFEDLSKVHPARLIKILQKAKAVEKVEQQKFGQNFIRGA